VTQITAAEARSWTESAQLRQSLKTYLAPLAVCVFREPNGNADAEMIHIDGRLMTRDGGADRWLRSWLAAPTTFRVQHAGTDVIGLQAALQGKALRVDAPTIHVVVGVQDREVPVQFSAEPIVRWAQMVQTAPVYLGMTPPVNLLRRVSRESVTIEGIPLLRMPFGVWHHESARGFVVVSHSPSIVPADDLQLVPADRPAQIRLNVKDVRATQIESWFAALDFQRAHQMSVGNTRLAHALSEQLGITPDRALQVGEAILGVDLICGLGGKYTLQRHNNGIDYWTSTAWPPPHSAAQPADQTARHAPPVISPLLQWFRGIDAELALDADGTQLRAVVRVRS
jgi:hypothetical protein